MHRSWVERRHINAKKNAKGRQVGPKQRIKWDENNSVSIIHVFSSFLSSITSISFNLSQFLISFPRHLILSPFIFPFRRVSVTALLSIIFLIFPPSSASSLFHHSCAFSPPASCSALMFGSGFPAASPLLLWLSSSPYALFLSHTDSVFYLFTFLSPSLPLCLSVSRRIRFIYIQPVTSAMEIY